MQANVLAADFGVHFDTVLYPFSLIEILSTLEKLGYDISPDIPYPRPIGRFAGAGGIARKGKSTIHVESNAQLLMASGNSISSALASFDEVAKALAEDHKIDINSLAKFYRLTANYEFETKNNALEKIANSMKIALPAEIGKAIGDEIKPIELKFGSTDLKPNSDNWFDISIRANYERNDRYVMSLIYRNDSRQKTLDFVAHIEENVVRIAEFVDR